MLAYGFNSHLCVHRPAHVHYILPILDQIQYLLYRPDIWAQGVKYLRACAFKCMGQKQVEKPSISGGMGRFTSDRRWYIKWTDTNFVVMKSASNVGAFGSLDGNDSRDVFDTASLSASVESFDGQHARGTSGNDRVPSWSHRDTGKTARSSSG